MDISGASEVKGIINATRLNLDISGASVARLSGTAKNALIDASGACKVNSYELSSRKLQSILIRSIKYKSDCDWRIECSRKRWFNYLLQRTGNRQSDECKCRR